MNGDKLSVNWEMLGGGVSDDVDVVLLPIANISSDEAEQRMNKHRANNDGILKVIRAWLEL